MRYEIGIYLLLSLFDSLDTFTNHPVHLTNLCSKSFILLCQELRLILQVLQLLLSPLLGPRSALMKNKNVSGGYRGIGQGTLTALFDKMRLTLAGSILLNSSMERPFAPPARRDF